jgi:D-xylose transport system substrate-binding protein
MNATTRRFALGMAAMSLSLPLAGCGQSTPPSAADSQTIGLLLPERSSSSRYESFDLPLIQQSVSGMCSKCTVDYANADGSTDAQKQQFDALVAKGVKVILLDPVDAKSTAPWVATAAKKGIRVVAYDRLAAGDVAAYISFDNERTGELQGQALLDALGGKAASAQIVMINGAESDPNAADFKTGAHRALDGKVKSIGYEASGQWKPDVAAQETAEAIGKLGKNGVQAVYSANDGMAAAVIDTLHKAGLDGVKVGGQDADIAAVRRILTGEQAYTIYKPYRPEADAAATIAVYILNGMDASTVATSLTTTNGAQIPSMLLTPVVVNRSNLAATVIAGGLYKAADLCAGPYANACAGAGIKY